MESEQYQLNTVAAIVGFREVGHTNLEDSTTFAFFDGQVLIHVYAHTCTYAYLCF